MVNSNYRQPGERPFSEDIQPPKEESAEILENNPDLYLSQNDPVTLTDQAEQLQQLQMAIDELTDAQKLVITLRFGNRLSLEDTAGLMGREINTVKALQFRAMQTLRRKLGSQMI
jgi:RNA polymerase sigma factor (sigma-70 family)